MTQTPTVEPQFGVRWTGASYSDGSDENDLPAGPPGSGNDDENDTPTT